MYDCLLTSFVLRTEEEVKTGHDVLKTWQGYAAAILVSLEPDANQMLMQVKRDFIILELS